MSRSSDSRPDLVAKARDRLSAVELAWLRIARDTWEHPASRAAAFWLQRNVGSQWIDRLAGTTLHVGGLERLPRFDPAASYVLVSNHRTLVDQYVITSHLVRHRLIRHRIIFPVKSEFFYDHPLGGVVNGCMSFFAMYPPIFRDVRRASLNLLGMDELAWLAERGGVFIGIHPEGRRNRDPNPYSLLPAQRGVGRLIQQTGALVIPAFLTGVDNDLPGMVRKVLAGRARMDLVFGAPIDFTAARAERPSPKVQQAIADQAMAAVAALAAETRDLRRAAGVLDPGVTSGR